MRPERSAAGRSGSRRPRHVAVTAGVARLVGHVCAALLAVMVATMLLQVFCRYVLDASLSWSEELTRLLFVWLTFLGFGLAAEREALPAISLVTDRLPARVVPAVQDLRDALSLAVAFLMAGSGGMLAREVAAQPTPALHVSAGWFPAAVATGGGLLAFLLAAKTLARTGSLSRAAPIVVLGALAAAGVAALPADFAPVGVVTAIVFIAVSAVGVPIALALAAAAFVGLADAGMADLDAIARQLAEGVDSFLLLAIPFFMLTGVVMSRGGLAERLVVFAQTLVGWMRGGLAQIDIIVSAIFADISGSAVGDAASVGGVLIPQMIRRGYPPRFAAAVQAAGGTLGLLFPPATSLIVYSSVTNVPIASLFAAAIVPGLCVTAAFMAVNFVMARRLGLPPAARFAAAEIPKAFASAILPLLTIVIIIGGILGGVFTPTESGVVAIAYSLVVALFATRSLRLRALPGLLTEASVNTARVTSIIAGAMAVGWLLALSGIPASVSAVVLGKVATPLAGLLLINVIFFAMHVVMEAAPAILIVTPVLLPAIASLHIDPVLLGVSIMINSGIGLILPPMGILTYLTASIAEVGSGTVFRTVVPYALALLSVLLLIALVPGVAAPRL